MKLAALVLALASAFTMSANVHAMYTGSQLGARHMARAELQRRSAASATPARRMRKRCTAPQASSVLSSAAPAAAAATVAASPASQVGYTPAAPAVVSPSAQISHASQPPASSAARRPPPSSAPPQPTSSSAPPTQTGTSGPSNGHKFTFKNNCANAIKPVIADTSCGYSPRCAGASHFSGPQPASIPAGQTSSVFIDNDWVGRIFADNGRCGAKGENCSMLEFNLDSGSFYTPQAYDISNIQGFTQSMSLGAVGCDTVTCTSASCSCNDAYPVGDMSGCGADLPVRGCVAGPVAFNVVFCP